MILYLYTLRLFLLSPVDMIYMQSVIQIFYMNKEALYVIMSKGILYDIVFHYKDYSNLRPPLTIE